MNNKIKSMLQITKSATKKIKDLMVNKNEKKKRFRIYVSGGGCNGLKYNFIFDDVVNEGDKIFNKKDIVLIIDPMSFQYLIGSFVDYVETLEGSHFVVKNPNIKNTCRCGSSFSI